MGALTSTASRPDTAKQRTTDDWTYQKAYLDPDDPTKVLRKTFTETAGSSTIGERAKNQKALLAEDDKVASQAATNAKNLASANKPKTDNWQETAGAASAAAARGDTAEATRLTNLYHEQLRGQQTLKETPAGGAAPGAYTAPPAGSPAAGQVQATTKSGEPVVGAKQGWGGGDPSSTFEKMANGLVDGSVLYSKLPPRALKGQPTKNDIMARAMQIAEDKGVPFNEEIIQAEVEYFTTAQPAFNAMDRLVGPVSNPHDPDNPSLLDQLAIQVKRAEVTSPGHRQRRDSGTRPQVRAGAGTGRSVRFADRYGGPPHQPVNGDGNPRTYR